DTDPVGPGVGEDLVAVGEGARLGGAAAGVVLGVEIQDNNPLAEPVLQPDRCTGLRREGEVGGPVADLNAVCHTLPPCVPAQGPRASSISVASPHMPHPLPPLRPAPQARPPPPPPARSGSARKTVQPPPSRQPLAVEPAVRDAWGADAPAQPRLRR